MVKKKKLTGVAQKTLALMRQKAASRKKKNVRARAPMRMKIVKPDAPKALIRKASYSREELEHFRSIILEKKKEILEELEALRDTMMDSTTGEYASESSTYSTHMEQGTDAMEREKTFLFA